MKKGCLDRGEGCCTEQERAQLWACHARELLVLYFSKLRRGEIQAKQTRYDLLQELCLGDLALIVLDQYAPATLDHDHWPAAWQRTTPRSH